MNEQLMTEATLLEWIEVLGLHLTDVYEAAAANYFYVSFERDLTRSEIGQIESLGFAVNRTPPLRHRYSMVWQPSGDDER